MKPKVVLLIFVSGKIVLTGAKVREEIYMAFNQIYSVLVGTSRLFFSSLLSTLYISLSSLLDGFHQSSILRSCRRHMISHVLGLGTDFQNLKRNYNTHPVSSPFPIPAIKTVKIDFD